MRRNTRLQRRGLTAVLAMLYLVLFATLAVGFFGAVNTSVQISTNEQKTNRAMLAAESGMQFIRYHLWHLSIPPNTEPDDLLDEVYFDLAERLHDTPNMGDLELDYDGAMITIPAAGEYIASDSNGGRFRVTITREGVQLVVKTVGAFSNTEIARAVQLTYDIAEKASSIFDYGLAAKGPVVTGGNSGVRGMTDPSKGSVLSAYIDSGNATVNIGGNKGITGDITYMEGSAYPEFDAKVGDQTDPDVIKEKHIHSLSEAPEFPTIITSIFEPYATNVYPVKTNGIYENVRIPAGQNPTFNGGDVIRGVLLIEQPNKVTFNGNVKIEGVVVMKDTGAGDMDSNYLLFTGNGGTKTGVEDLPSEAKFSELRKLTGSFVLAPGGTVEIKGNFGAVNGSIVADKIDITGSVSATVKGTLISLDDHEPMSVWGTGEVIIASTGTSNYPAGLRFGQHYFPVPGTYEEVKP